MAEINAQKIRIRMKAYDFKLLDNMMIFDPKVITNPAGVRSVEWLKTLKPEFVKMDVPTFKQ